MLQLLLEMGDDSPKIIKGCEIMGTKLNAAVAMSSKNTHKKSGHYFLVLVCAIFLSLLAGCETTTANRDNGLNYHNENYGFSISIPEGIYGDIYVQYKLSETDGGKIHFIYQKSHGDGTESSGILFTMEIKNKDDYPNKNSLDSTKIIGENDDYYFLFNTIEEPIEEMTLEKVYEENKEAIKKIPDSFVLD